MTYAIIGIISTIVLFILWYIVTSNNLIAKRNKTKQCSSGICVALKQRNDMIPNLVATVKNYADHENSTLVKIVELRSQADKTDKEDEQIKIGNQISSLLPKLKVAVEDYPELKADKHFLELQHSISDMEDEINAIRRTYNAAAVDYNNYIEMFPSSFVANRTNHTCVELIDIPEAEKANVNVKELFGHGK